MSDDTDSDGSEFEATLTAAFVDEYSADEATASDAAGKAASFREDHAADLTTDDVLDALAGAPYDEFTHVFDYGIGHLADANEDCTDSRAYRLSGFADLAADPTQGA